jgi:hypothetical protein
MPEEMVRQRLRSLLYDRRRAPTSAQKWLALIAMLQVVILVELLIN